ncbi:MAG: hypothetical protein R2753_03335 [Chitinophagales bacterium]
MNKLIGLISVLLVFTIIGCLNRNGEIDNGLVSKIITTKTYDAKIEFDSLVIGKPQTWLGYDETIGEDYSWSRKHFDKYNNLILEEKIRTKPNGEDEYETDKKYEYYNFEKGALESVYDHWRNEREEIIRNESDDVLEIRKYEEDSLIEKSIINTINDSIKEVKSFKQNGLSSTITYIFNKINGENKTTFYKNEMIGSLETIKYKYSFTGDLIKEISEKYDEGKLVRKSSVDYSDFVNDKPCLIISENYDIEERFFTRRNDDPSTDEVIRPHPFTRDTIYKTFDSYGNLKSFRKKSIDLDVDGKEIDKDFLDQFVEGLSGANSFELDYSYNDHDDWIKLILTNGKGDKYIVIRDIEYK